MIIECPVCGKGDSVEKVSSIAPARETGRAFEAVESSKTSPALAQLLAQPGKPRWHFWEGGCGCLLGIGALGIALAIPLYLMGLLGIIFRTSTSVEPAAEAARQRADEILLVSAAAIIAAFVALVLYTLYAAYKRERQQDRRLSREVPAWRMAMRKWNRLYYCHRDGIVFNPGTAEQITPGQVKKYVYVGTNRPGVSSQ